MLDFSTYKNIETVGPNADGLLMILMFHSIGRFRESQANKSAIPTKLYSTLRQLISQQ